MKTSPRPTRAEVNDVSNAIIDGSTAILLCGETASGKHPIEALNYLNRICLETEKYLDLTNLSCYLSDFKKTDLTSPLAYKKVMCYSSCVTVDGMSPIILSGYRAKAPIFAITKNEQLARHLSLYWNVHPVFVESSVNSSDLVQKDIEKFKELKLLIPGDTVIIAGNDEINEEEKHASMVSFIMKVK